MGQPSAFASRFAARHGGGGHLTFVDGHVQWFRGEQVVETKVPKANGSAIWPQNEIIWSAHSLTDPNLGFAE